MSQYLKKNQSNYYKSIKYADALLLRFLRNPFPQKVYRRINPNFARKRTLYSLEISQIFKDAFFIEFMLVAASVLRMTLIMAQYKNVTDYVEAVVQRCSVKKVFLEISQNSQESTCA